MRKSKFFLNLGQIKNSWSDKIPALDLDLILADAINQPREFIITHPEFRPNPWQLLKIYINLSRRNNDVPIAYITGHKEFFGLDFFVNKNVLVPRPDTEILVETAISLISNIFKSQNLSVIPTAKEESLSGSPHPITLIDVGTGSGCIPIAINKTLQQLNTATNKQTGITTHAIDISHRALRVVKKNAKKHNVKINFHQGNLIEPIAKSSIFSLQSSLIITANLPYLTQSQFDNEQSIKKEPKLALVADNQNGLSLYEKLLTQLKSSIFNLQSSITLLLEIDPSQTTDIRTLVKNIFPSAQIEIKKDLAGLDRVVIIQLITSTTTSHGTI
ncbi:MAG: hypothetical protein A3J93_01765 [Candidatus Magasanikbacteria bacterium RIFOXYC2_FULL_42_28]|uniref:Protein-(Glutamine-N5) methyltransferase, release factor-specific n=1 Tax=Candidatus Magasanikbacteria bacterium RIFOXYC2_FULL_42_28 TaxID=1798704 RepID=A0A1F6NY06_9BACT|nr:MAG: hypothetical protein A3J93_01765 [Candidatus Magasanikbacteria bacterium RIFOXYC2_FULL_42_28]